MRPWIAIVGELVGDEPPAVRLSLRYTAAIERAGGQAFVVPYPGPAEGADPDDTSTCVDELVARSDGLVFSGGDDFDTARLGLGPTHPAAKPVPRRKQDFDLLLARRALAAGLPTLGICYGMQLLALAEGGTIFQHLPEDRPGAQPHAGGVRHAVEVRAGTKLGALLEVERIDVVSRHHQAVASVGAGWEVSGQDREGLIEAIERTDHPFALGVQWHPELANDAAQERIFTALVEAARSRSRTRSATGGPVPGGRTASRTAP